MILRGWPDTFKEISTNLSYRDELAIENGILLKSGRIMIPKSMQPEISKKFTMVKELRDVSYGRKAVYFGAMTIRIYKEL